MNINMTRNRFDLMLAGAGALVSVAMLALGMILVGQVSGGEARSMLDAMLPTTRFLSSSVMTASGTILALMLTMLSLSAATDQQLKDHYFRRIRQIAFAATTTFIMATAILCLHSVPITESSETPPEWYRYAYWTLLGSSALLGGTLTAVALMLYFAVKDVISLQAPGGSSDLIETEGNQD